MFALDTHCHFFPQAFLDAARKPNSFRASLTRRDDGREHLLCPGNFDHPLTPNFYAAEQMLADMDKTGITMAAISAAPPTLSYWAEAGAARELAAAMNESIAQRVQQHPDRFLGLATVPLQDIDASVREAKRAIGELGLHGFQIGSNVGGKNLNHPDYFPFFETVAALNVPLFIHPYIPAGEERMQDYYLHNLLGMVAETGLAIASVIYGVFWSGCLNSRSSLPMPAVSFPISSGVWIMVTRCAQRNALRPFPTRQATICNRSTSTACPLIRVRCAIWLTPSAPIICCWAATIRLTWVRLADRQQKSCPILISAMQRRRRSAGGRPRHFFN
jgi:hypothetical protein